MERANPYVVTGNVAPRQAPGHRGIALIALLAAVLPWFAAFQPAAAQDAEPLTFDGDPIRRLVPHVPGSDRLYVVGEDGLYRGDAAGLSWVRVGDELPDGEIVAAVDDADVLLAGDAPICGRGDGGTPLSRSLDGGQTWEEVADVADIRPLAVWGEIDLALGGSCEGPQISLDNGTTWALIEGTTLGQAVTAFAVVSDDEADARRVLVSTTGEGGTSQLYEIDLSDPAAPQVSEPLKEYFGLGAVAGMGEQRVLAAADGVWLSIDEGERWTLRANGLEDVILSVDPLVENIPEDEAERGFGLNAIALDPTRADQIAVGSVGGLYVSDTAGADWTLLEDVDEEVRAVVITDVGSLVLVETENAVVAVRPWDF